MPSSLPVLPTVMAVYAFVLGRFATILRLVWVPAAFSLLIQIAAVALNGLGLSAELAAALSFVVQIATLVLSAMIAVAVHRLALFDEAPAGVAPVRFGREVALFVLASAVLVLGASIAFALLATPLLIASGYQPPADGTFDLRQVPPLGQAALALAGLAVAWPAARLSLVFPVIVAEAQISFARAWALTAASGWRVLAVVVLAVVPLVVASLAIAAFGTAVGSPALSGAMTAAEFRLTSPSFWVFLAYLFVSTVAASAIGVAALSFSFKALTGRAAG